MKGLKSSMDQIKILNVLTRSQLKNILGGQVPPTDNGCPENTYACYCRTSSGGIDMANDSYGTNIAEATQNSSNYCQSMGYAGATCSINWTC